MLSILNLMYTQSKLELIFTILFKKPKSVLIIQKEPTEGDTITIGNMKATFNKVRKDK